VIESAVIQTEIDGAAVINGNLTLDQAKATASLLRVESIPLDLVFGSQQSKPAGG
jgi:preprotein translocase subunit SecD